MALPRTIGLAAALALLAATLLLGLSATAAPGTAHAATAAGSCGGVTLSPAARTVRRGGQVLLQGQACGASYSSSGSDAVQVKLRKGKRWGVVGSGQADEDGSFSICARVRVPRRVRVARLRATSSSGGTGTTALRVANRGPSTCSAADQESGSDTSSSGETPSGETPTPPPPPPPPPPPGSVLREDPATNPDPMPLWNAIDAASPSRHQRFASGGPSGGPFRRMSVEDGDDSWGERAELGYNSRMNGLGAPWGTFFLYGEDDRRVTDFSMRLPTNFPINTSTWQVVMQMKQTGPSANSGGTPVLALEAREGRWVLTQSDSPGASNNTHELWSTPATLGQWTPISLDVTYSPDPSRGKVQITVGGAESPTFTTFTQKYELSPAGQGLSAGDAIPSHLRMGIYHNPSLPGTHVDFSDVRVSS